MKNLKKIGWSLFTVSWLPFGVGMFMVTSRAGSGGPSSSGLAVLVTSIAMQLVGVILTVIGGIQVHGAKVRTGPLVIGTVVGTQQTGMRVNNQPQLEVTIQFTTVDGRQITASDRKVIPLHELALVQPGVSLPLRYDPQNPERIMIETKADQATLQQAYDALRLASGQVTQESLYIAKNGVRAQGVVLSAQPTGNIVGGCGEMLLHVRVTGSQYGDSFDVTVTKPVPQWVLHRVQTGSVIDVYYIPGNEQNITIALSAG